jgi:hypothetical protein
MRDQWLKYLSGEKRLVPYMEQYFNDEIDFEMLNQHVMDLGLMHFLEFKKEKALDNLLND